MTLTDRSAFDADLPDQLTALGTVAGPDPRVLQTARSALAHRITAAGGRTDRSPLRQKRRRLTIVLTAGIATAAAVSAPATVSFLTGDRSAGPAGQVATVAPTPDPMTTTAPDGRHAAWWYIKSTYRSDPTAPLTTRQIWVSPTKPSRLIDPRVPGSPLYLINEDAHGPGKDRSRFGIVGTDHRPVYWSTLWQLPTDPTKLGTLLRQGSSTAAKGRPEEVFVVVGDMLRESPAPQALRKALYQVALAVPGARNLGPIQDSQGRAGLAVELATGTDGTHLQRYIFDPHTFQFLEETDGKVIQTYLLQGPVTNDHTVPKP
jgi:hypothetical protein